MEQMTGRRLCLPHSTLVGWGTISLNERRCFDAALPPAIELGSIPYDLHYIPIQKAPQGGFLYWSRCRDAAKRLSNWVRFPTIHIKSKEKDPRLGVFSLEQMTGIEPAYSAWEADVLPLNYICVYLRYYYSTAVPSLSITQK